MKLKYFVFGPKENERLQDSTLPRNNEKMLNISLSTENIVGPFILLSWSNLKPLTFLLVKTKQVCTPYSKIYRQKSKIRRLRSDGNLGPTTLCLIITGVQTRMIMILHSACIICNSSNMFPQWTQPTMSFKTYSLQNHKHREKSQL